MSTPDLIEPFNRDFLHHPLGHDGEVPFVLRHGELIARFHGLRLHTRLRSLLARDGGLLGHVADTEVFSAGGQPLSAWTPYASVLDNSAITHLDRLIRTLHVLNALSALDGRPLWLGIHPLHVRAVPDAHGTVFGSILRRCGLRPSQVVLEFTDTERLGRAHLSKAIAGFREHGYGIAFGVRGDDDVPLDALLALRPDAVRIAQGALLAATLSSLDRAELAQRIARIHDAGALALLRGVGDAAQRALALELGADGWQAAETATTPSQERSA